MVEKSNRSLDVELVDSLRFVDTAVGLEVANCIVGR